MQRISATLFLLCCMPTMATAQHSDLFSGPHYPLILQSENSIRLEPLQEEVDLVGAQTETAVRDEDRFDQIIRATVRVTVSGVCGSGTVVGRDSSGNALVLTNAHVAGSSRGRTVNVERWEPSGHSERGQGTIIAAGYGRGMSVDFALLRCNAEFASDVTPIPLADRYPDPEASVTSYGCPRCEWPSLQVLKLNRREGQVLTWRPQAIGGRSGSSVIDHTDAGPRVVGLLTWGGGGEGLGQSTPFLLNAMRGRLPTSLESLPAGVTEVSDSPQDQAQAFGAFTICQMPASTDGETQEQPVSSTDLLESSTNQQLDSSTLDAITEEGLRDRRKPKEESPEDNGLLRRPREPGFIERTLQWFRRTAVVIVLCAASSLLGYFVGRVWK